VRYGLDVDRLLEESPSQMFEEWRTLYEMEPWADERSDLAAGIQIMHNVNAAGVDPRQPAEYMPYLRREPAKPQSEADIKQAFNAICDIRRKELAMTDPGPDISHEMKDPFLSNP
jgi:hypothetical protein